MEVGLNSQNQNNMKSILCLIDNLGQGGAERQMVGLSVLLKRKGYNVDLVVYHKEDFYVSTAREGGIEPIVLDVNNSKWSKLRGVRELIKKKGGYDCVIGYKEGANSIGCLLKALGMKFKLMVSDRITTQKLTRSNRIRFFLYRFADYIVPNSYSERTFIASHYPHYDEKIIPITNFTDTNHFTPVEREKGDKLRILTAARVSSQKNIINYIRAISQLNKQGVNNVVFDWYGRVENGETEYANQCHSLVDELGLSEMFHFYPATNDIVTEYHNCDIFCLPSSFEGFPNVVCEAMSCGKPILCSRVCDNELIVANGKNGLLFDPNNVDDIAEKILAMINMPVKERDEWGRYSRIKAVDEFSEETFVQKYIKLIES